MKKILKKIKDQPLPKLLLGSTILLWIYPFIEAMIYGATGFYDLSIVALILLILGGTPILYFMYIFIKTIIHWISLLFKRMK
jgi:hypothetical protein